MEALRCDCHLHHRLFIGPGSLADHVSPSSIRIISSIPMYGSYCKTRLMLSSCYSLICLASSLGLSRQGSQGFLLQRLPKCQQHLCTASLLGRCHCEGNLVQNCSCRDTALGDGMFQGIDLSAKVFVEAQGKSGEKSSSNSPILNSSSHFNL